MIQKHLPAIGPDLLKRAASVPGSIPTHWLDPAAGSPPYYPWALTSYYHARKAVLDFPPDLYLFGDSGGYSILTTGANIDPVDVIRWQIRLCTVGVILDVPPFARTESSLFGGAFEGAPDTNWAPALAKTARHVERALPIYQEARKNGTDFRWWGVVQGQTLLQMTEWYDRIASIYPFDGEGEGWAFKIHPLNDPRSLARYLRFAQERKIRRIHILGGIGFPGLTTLFALGPQAGIEFATYDSSSSIARGLRRAVLVPGEDGVSFSERIENYRDRGETTARGYLRDVCACWSCASYRQELAASGEEWGPEPLITSRMIFHNHLTTLGVLNRIHERAASEPNFFRQMLGKRYGPTLRAFEGRDSVSAPTGTPVSLLERQGGKNPKPGGVAAPPWRPPAPPKLTSKPRSLHDYAKDPEET